MMLLLVETDGGVTVMSRQEAKDLIRSQLAGANMVEQLVAQRRLAAAREDEGHN